ncbi:MAG: pyridoxamine 5'-phosphate oxidase [Flavobacteriales bacterium]|nr:pyridoxamine 5'-phosphate oxidase [Flavobacteriales bacterium]
MTAFDDRKVYAKGSLDDAEGFDVLQLLTLWLEEAKASDPDDYNAMTLSTVGSDGHPNARIVLLRAVQSNDAGDALTFYTNYQSAKGRELLAHPHAAATFFWRDLERQLRVRGRVEQMPEADSDRYFESRPRASQIGAWASSQSEEVEGRSALENAYAAFEDKFEGAVPRPPHWGGFLLHIEEIEFWQGRPGRMHDRLVARKSGHGWTRRRLQP